MSIEDRVKALEREIESLNTQMSWIVWTRLLWLVLFIAGAVFLISTFPG
jgi:hypothetical protein